MPQAVTAIVAFVAGALETVGLTVGIAKAIATVAVNLAVSLATNAALAALAQPADPGGGLNPAQFSKLNADPLSERVIVYGETGLAGEVVFQQLVSPSKDTAAYVIALADAGQVQGHELVQVLIDGEPESFDVAGVNTGDYGDSLEVHFYSGTPSQVASARMVELSDGLWTSAHRGRSVCYAVMVAEVGNQDAFPNGRPNPIFAIKGRRVYDPRLDSTAGGSGSHRINDESTWEWSDNAALIAYDYMRGIYIEDSNGDPVRVAGLGLSESMIDLDWIAASANVCDDEGWAIDGAFTAGSDPVDVLQSFAVHMAGRIVQRKGRFAIIAGSDWAPTLTIEEGDLAGSPSITYAQSWRETSNAIKATYRDSSADGNYESTETRLYVVDAWVEQDNAQTLETTLTTAFTNTHAQAVRLAKAHLYRQRAPRTIECAVKLKRMQAFEGDFVTVDWPSYSINETYEVVQWTLDQSGFVQLKLRLWDADGLTWASGEDGGAPSFGILERPALTPEDADGADWALTPVTVGGAVPAILVAGVSPDWIDAIVIEWRENGDTDWNNWGELTPGAPSTTIIGLARSTTYEISIRYKIGNLLSPTRLIESVTTGATFVAGTIAGQGSLATLSQVNLGASGRVYREDGITRVTDAAAITSLGTAAAISGQGDLATTNKAALELGYANAAPNSEFRHGSTYPPRGYASGGRTGGVGTFSGSIITAGPRRAMKGLVTGTPSSGNYLNVFEWATTGSAANLSRYWLPVLPGDRVAASCLVAKNSSCSSAYVGLFWFDASGAYLSESAGSSVTGNADGDTGDPSVFTLSTVVGTAPANARFAAILVRGIFNGSANPAAWAMSPMLCRVPSGQTAVPPYAPSIADRSADLTSEGVAASITGQGALATLNAVDLSSAQVTNKSLANLDSAQNTKLNSLAAGAYVPGGGSAQNAGLVSDNAGTWQTVAYVDVAIPAGGFVYFPNVYATFSAHGGAALTKAGVKIVESATDGSGAADRLTLSPDVTLSISETTAWEAPAAWATTATTPGTRNATRRFTLQIRRASGDGTAAIAALAAGFSAGVW